MTLAEIRTAVRERLDDPTFETQKIDRWANWVLDDIYTRYEFPFMSTEATLSTVDGTETYNYSLIGSDVDKIRSITNTTTDYGFMLDYIDPVELDNRYPIPADDAESQPLRWTVRDSVLKLNPIPDDAYTLTVVYKKVPSQLSASTDSPEIPERYMEAVILGIYYKAHEWNDDFDYASVIERQYEQKVRKMIQDYRETSGQIQRVTWDRPEIG